MKKGTKIFAFVIASLFLISFLAGVVSAENISAALGTGIKDFFTGLKSGIDALFGTTVSVQMIFLALLLYMVIYSIVGVLFSGTSPWITNGASIAIAALSVLFLSGDLVNAITIQYGAMGAAILTVIPLLIMLIFTIRVKSLIIARALWTFYAIYYVLLYVEAIGKTTDAATSAYYLGALVIGICLAIFVKPLRALFTSGKLDAAEEAALSDLKLREAGKKVSREEARAALFGKK